MNLRKIEPEDFSSFQYEIADTLYIGSLNIFDEEIIPIWLPDSIDKEKFKEQLKEEERNRLYYNSYGQFLYGIYKYNYEDSVITGYVDVKLSVGNICSSLIANGLLHNLEPKELEDPFIQRIIVTEFYFHMMNYLEIKASPNTAYPQVGC